ncbi:MAG: hypothetical protein CMJ67_10040 [Planctomycetaceae bacterium]|nr:hypothetical protein [Planctomycetaceae bacterium]
MNRTALRKILAEEGLIPSRTASAPTALAKLILTVPGYESLSSRDAMNVAKQLVKALFKEVRDEVKHEVDFATPVVTAEGDGEYEEVVGQGGGPAWGSAPGWGDEEYYDVTETVEFEYPSRMKFELEVRADLGGAGFPMDDEGIDEEDLFAVLAKSRLWTTIVKDAIKGMWRKWLQKYAAHAFGVHADAFVWENGLSYGDQKIEEYKPFNVTYQVTKVDTDYNGDLSVDLVLVASFNAPEIIG